MAGTNPAFPSQVFRDAIRSAAAMSSPNEAELVPTLRWDEVRTFAQSDAAGRPYFFNATETPVTDVKIADLVLRTMVAVVEKTIEPGEGTRAGIFRGSKCTLTIMDVDFRAIVAHGAGRFADAVLIGETEYRVQEIPKPDALFDVDVFSVHCFAQSIASQA